MTVAVGLAVAAGVSWTTVAWSWRPESSDSMIAISLTLTIVALVAVFSGSMFVVETESGFLRLLSRGVVVSMTTLAAVLITLTWTTWWQRYDRFVITAMSIWSLATLGGMLFVPSAVRARARRKPVAAESIPDRIVLEMTCPRCGAAQHLAKGVGRCVKCRLRVVIDVEEPRCACGYLLFRLEGDLCPECGRVV